MMAKVRSHQATRVHGGEPAWRSRPCPTCQATPGQFCRRPTGAVRGSGGGYAKTLKGPHPTRTQTRSDRDSDD